MTKTQFRLGALLIFAAILLNNLTSPDRYRYHKDSSLMEMSDGVTGYVYRFNVSKGGWHKVVPPKPKTKLGTRHTTGEW